jgi:hypothetical protein
MPLPDTSYLGWHSLNGASSSLHSKVEPSSVLVKVNLAEVLFVKGGGPETILVSGRTVSTIQLRVTAGLSPLASLARTAKV